MRVVIAHDFMEMYGGAERVTEEIANAFPDAPVWTILGRQEVADRMGVGDRWHSVLPQNEALLRNYRRLAPALPSIVSLARLPEADVLITSSYAFAHHFRTRDRAPQICYCHSPLRFAWTMTREYRDEWAGRGVRGRAFDMMVENLRRADIAAARRVTHYLTSSGYVAGQIEEFYGRTAEVIGAPINTGRFTPVAERRPERDPFFLLCGRMVEPYKKMDVAIEAFRQLPHLRLVVAGDGPARERLQQGAPPNVEFLGQLVDDDLVPMLQRCEALIFPSQDDLGLLPLEAMACGRPVLAFNGGGARHTVVRGLTGDFFEEQTVEAIVDVVRRFDVNAYDPVRIRDHLVSWDRQAFRRRLHDAVESVLPVLV